MFDFRHLDPAQRVSKFPAPWFGDGAFLTLRCAHDTANPSYALAKSEAMDRADAAIDALSGRVRPEAADEMREIDRKLFPVHVVTGWSGVLSADGQRVEYSVDACRSLFGAIPAWILDKIRLFALRPENFVGLGTPMAPKQAESIAGNSSAG